MGSFKKKQKRLLSGVLSTLVGLSILPNMSLGTVHADSTDRLAVNIKWAQNKGFEDMLDEDLSGYTSEDLRMIGVFLSNFYSPFSTCIGKSDTTGAEETMKNMVDALTDQCNFEQDVAEHFVKLIWDMSSETVKPLYFAKINDNVSGKDSAGDYAGDKNIIESEHLVKDISVNNIVTPNADGLVEATMYNFLLFTAGSLGDSQPLADFTKDYGGVDDYDADIHSGFKSFAMFWQDDAKKDHIVWSNTVGSPKIKIKRVICLRLQQ